MLMFYDILLFFSICDDMSSSSIKLFDRNFGRSLLAGYSNHYLSDFVLHGTSEVGFHHKLMNDLQLSVQVRTF